MYAVIVRCEVRPDRVEQFRQLALHNARETRKEPGNLQFDVLRSPEDPCRFALVEIYRDAAALGEHQKTAHYARWKEEVPGLLARPRVSEKYEVLPREEA